MTSTPMSPLSYDPVQQDGLGRHYWIMWDRTGGVGQGSNATFDSYQEARDDAARFLRKNPIWHHTGIRSNFRSVYVASKTLHGPMWQSLRGQGLPIISTWISEWEVGATSDWTDLWRRCVEEASRADVLLAYRRPDETLKGGLVEVGAALASGRPVVAVGCDDLSFTNHRMVVRAPTLEAALEIVAPNLDLFRPAEMIT